MNRFTRALGLLSVAVLTNIGCEAAAHAAEAEANENQPELAAASCTGGPTVTDFLGNTWATKTCPTWTAANVVYGESTTGRLYAGRNWFACQQRFPNSRNPDFGRGYLNDVWLWTQGDEAFSQDGWGWVPATAVSIGNNWEFIPGVPICT